MGPGEETESGLFATFLLFLLLLAAVSLPLIRCVKQKLFISYRPR
jgi:hypothetical protein